MLYLVVDAQGVFNVQPDCTKLELDGKTQELVVQKTLSEEKLTMSSTIHQYWTFGFFLGSTSSIHDPDSALRTRFHGLQFHRLSHWAVNKDRGLIMSSWKHYANENVGRRLQ